MVSVRLTKAAAQDIEDLRRYGLLEFGPLATQNYLTGLHAALARLKEYPGMGISRDDLRPGTRSLRYRSHRIYYRPSPGGLVIQRILHYARMVRRGMMP